VLVSGGASRTNTLYQKPGRKTRGLELYDSLEETAHQLGGVQGVEGRVN